MQAKVKTQLAKEFRKNPTRSEKIMWNVLRRKDLSGLKFRRQHVIKGYILDFYCHELRLAIEIDGGVHLKQISEDIKRQKIIEEDGIRFFRITSYEVEYNINLVLNKIKFFINNLKSLRPDSLYREERSGRGLG